MPLIYPFGFVGGGGALPVLAFTDSQVINNNQTTYNFTNKAIGAPAADRLVIVCAGAANNGGSVSSMQIGGSAGTELIDASSNGPGAIYSRLVTTGTTATMSVTFSTGQNQAAIAVYTITGLQLQTPRDSQQAAGNDPQVAIDVLAGGIIIAMGRNNTNTTMGMVGVNQDVTHTGSVFAFTAGSEQILAAEVGRTVQATFVSDNNPSLVAVAFR